MPAEHGGEDERLDRERRHPSQELQVWFVTEHVVDVDGLIGSNEQPSIQTVSPLTVVPAIAATGELVRGLDAPFPSTFSIEIGSERTRVPVA